MCACVVVFVVVVVVPRQFQYLFLNVFLFYFVSVLNEKRCFKNGTNEVLHVISIRIISLVA